MYSLVELRCWESLADLVDGEVAFVVELDEEGDELGRVAVAFGEAGVCRKSSKIRKREIVERETTDEQVFAASRFSKIPKGGGVLGPGVPTL